MTSSQWSGAILGVLCLLLSIDTALAFRLSPEVAFDPANQQFFVRLRLPSCPYDQLRKGNLTQYIHVVGLDRYTAAQPYRYDNYVEVRGSFNANTTYQLRVDGRICDQADAYSGTVSTGRYPAAIEFLSRGLYFSKINPQLRFRHREVSAIQWKIFRIGKDNRYLLSQTEQIKLKLMQATGEMDTTSRDARAGQYYYFDADDDVVRSSDLPFRHLEDFPGKLYEVSTTVERGDDWQVDALDLLPYYREGEWLVIVAGTPGTQQKITWQGNKLIQFTNLGAYVRRHQGGLWGQTLALDTGTPVFASVALKQRNGEVLQTLDTDVEGRFAVDWNTLRPGITPAQLHRIEVARGEDSVEGHPDRTPDAGGHHRAPAGVFLTHPSGLL